MKYGYFIVFPLFTSLKDKDGKEHTSDRFEKRYFESTIIKSENPIEAVQHYIGKSDFHFGGWNVEDLQIVFEVFNIFNEQKFECKATRTYNGFNVERTKTYCRPGFKSLDGKNYV